jgi:hypothetical protein
MPELDFSLAEWISILKLSTMWEFTPLRQYALTQIPEFEISSARRINLARDYHIQEWLLPALVGYAQQADAITADDVDLLGWEFVLKLLQAREQMGNLQVGHAYGYVVFYNPGIEARVAHDFTKAIEVVFREEIERMHQMYPG